MARFVARRLVHAGLVLLGTTFVLFCCLFVAGDPLSTLTGSRVLDRAARQELDERFGLDQPLPEQYVRYVSLLARADTGMSYQYDRPVNDILRQKVPNTVKLAAAALAIEMVIGIGAGLIAAVFRYSFWDMLVTSTTTLVFGLPAFVLALLLQDVFAVKLDWLPPEASDNSLKAYILPAISLAIVEAAFVARLMRGSMLEVLRADYVRTATAKGLSRRTVVLKHALRNSIIPVVTFLGIDFGFLLGGALITETIFDVDGVGGALAEALRSQDNPVIIAMVTYGALAFVLVNLVVDLACASLDPRIRLR